MQQKSLSGKLLTKILLIYFTLTLAVTLGQIIAEYQHIKQLIYRELQTIQHVVSDSLTKTIWEMNTQQTLSITNGLLVMPAIEGIIVRDDTGTVVTQQGSYIEISPKLIIDGTRLSDKSGFFGYAFPLVFEFSDRRVQVGDVAVFSSQRQIFEQIKVSIYFLIGNALLKSTLLIVLFIIIFHNYLIRPLAEFTQQIERLNPGRSEGQQIQVPQSSTELTVMADAFNRLITRIHNYKSQLDTIQQKLLISNEKLDKQNFTLEQEIARKTSGLTQAMVTLQDQKNELELKQQHLHEEIELRRHTESALRKKQTELENIVQDLKQTQERLIQSEKMMVLSGLLAEQPRELFLTINLADYLRDIIRSLNPYFHGTKHCIELNCSENLQLTCPSVAISQIITNLIMNSLIHGFSNISEGLIRITVLDDNDIIDIHFSDNGKGISPVQLEQLFSPLPVPKCYHSSKGLDIIYNLVQQILKGTIAAFSNPGKGLHYHIRFPKNLKITD